MNAEEWLHVDRIFHEALDREPGDRARYIEKECSDSPSLRQEVEGLLVSHGRAGNFLESTAASTVATSSLASGTRLGPYEILGPIGAGGMGAVYKAHDQRLTRDVAVKVLKHLDSDRAAWERFQREARAASALSHPNICTVHDVGEAEGQPYLVMELLEGVTLTAYIGEKPLEIDTTLSIAIQIVDALEAAHAKGIIHRDIKSANIMINSRGQVKVLDFGLARRLDMTRDQEAPTRDAVSAGGVRGTPAYMPPEVLQGEVADARGDLWAFGVLLYQMLTGRLPFTGETVYDISAAILKEPAPPLPASVPADLRAIVERCLAKQPEKRYQSAAEVRRALEALQTPAAPANGISRRTWLKIVGASAALLTVGAGAFLRRRSPTDFFWKDRLAAAKWAKLTDDPRSDEFGTAAISPDGKHAAYIRDLDGKVDAWVSPIGPNAKPVNVSNGGYILSSSTRNSRGVGFPPDRAEVWVTDNRTPDPIKPWLVPLEGGDPRPFPNYKDISRMSLAWSLDGRLAYHTNGPGDPIFVANSDGSDPVEVFPSKPGVHCHFPIWSPDGRHIYFVMGIPATEEMDIWRIGVSPAGDTPTLTDGPTQITFHNARVTYPDWLDERTLIYTAISEDSSAQLLYATDVEDRNAYQVLNPLDEQYLSVAASTGQPPRLIVTKAIPRATLHTLPVSEHLQTWKDAKTFDALNTRTHTPRHAPVTKAGDPDYLLFLASNGGRDGLCKLENGVPSVLWPESKGGVVTPPAISRDGHQICFSYRKEGKSGLHVMDLNGGNERALTDLLNVRGAASWSPDGRFVVVAGNRKDEVTRVFKVPLDPPGTPVPLVDALSYDPLWSPYDTFILYSEPGRGARTILKAVTSSGERVDLPQMPDLWGDPGITYRFVPGQKAIIALMANKETGRQVFNSLDLVTGKMRGVADLMAGSTFRNFDVSPDGKTIIFDHVENNSDIYWADLPEL